MKNILNIIWHDLKKCTSSVVAIITIMGLCIIPCLYAWFNIFSNWAPYDSDATGRIRVAVANEDAGAETLGLSVNVGKKIITGLQGNNAIGWVFVKSSNDALEGVYSGDYYAALVIPEDFSKNVISFISGDLENPHIKYYENEKKNAIAPKITGKAKTAVQESVNATFIETLAEYVADAVSVADATGFNPQSILSDLSGKIDLLSEELDNCLVMINAANGLSDSAQTLLEVSGVLTGSAGDAASAEKKVLDAAEDIPQEDDGGYVNVSESAKKIGDQNSKNLAHLEEKMNSILNDRDAYNLFVENELDAEKKLVKDTYESNEKTIASLKALGLNSLAEDFEDINKDLAAISAKLDMLVPATDENWPEMQKNVQDILDIINGNSSNGAGAKAKAERVSRSATSDDLAALDKSIKVALADTKVAIKGMKESLTNLESMMGDLGAVFGRYEKSLGRLDKGLGSTRSDLISLRRGLDVLSALMERTAGNRDISDANRLLSETSGQFASYLASPVKMTTSVIYPIATYGSEMAPFYTVLAQWVGALLTAVLIKVRIRKRDSLKNVRLYQGFFGRYGLYLLVGLAQALIVSLGDLLYVGIQCHSPVRFVLAACMNGIVFMMINYALVFALEDIGLGAGVIILVIQVAGSGGTYPVEVLPDIFKILYPFMPFKYSMNAMRECIGGMYGNTYASCMRTLVIFFLFFVVFGLVMYKPAKWLNNLIAKGKEASEIML